MSAYYLIVCYVPVCWGMSDLLLIDAMRPRSSDPDTTVRYALITCICQSPANKGKCSHYTQNDGSHDDFISHEANVPFQQSMVV